MTVLVTGAGGFIGSRLSAALVRDGLSVREMHRTESGRAETVCGDLLDPVSLRRACEGVDAVVHCAGYAHAMRTPDADVARRHHETNFIGTRNLAHAAADAGVGRFVHLSSVKAMGAPGSLCVDESWEALPETPYGCAKRKAERAVLEIASAHGIHATNLRLAMVYGRGSRGNLERMARAIARGWFPPLPETGMLRSLVHVADVIRAVRCVLARDCPPARTWIVAHPVAHSGAQIESALRAAAGRGGPRWHVPARALRAAGACGDLIGRLIGRRMPIDRESVDRLLGPECYRPDAIRRELGWQACVSLEDGCGELFGQPLPGWPESRP